MHFPFGQPWLCVNQRKEWNQQGWSQKGSRCVMSIKYWDSSFENKVSYCVLGKDSEPFLWGARVHPFHFLWLLPSNNLVKGGHKGQRARTALPSPSSERLPSACPRDLQNPHCEVGMPFWGIKLRKLLWKDNTEYRRTGKRTDSLIKACDPFSNYQSSKSFLILRWCLHFTKQLYLL